MKKLLVLIIILLVSSTLQAQTGLVKIGKDYCVANTVIIKLKQSPVADLNGNVVFSDDMKTALAPYNIKKAVQKFPVTSNRLYKTNQELDKIIAVLYSSNDDPLVISKKISKISGVEWAEPKYVRIAVQSTPGAVLDSVTQYYLTTIKASQAWLINKGDPSIIIAIIDSGVYWEHPELVNNIHQNLGEDANNNGKTIVQSGSTYIFDPGDINNIDNDSNGFIDDLIGWDFGGTAGIQDNNPEEDSPTHGTLVAGVALSIGNKCTIMPVKCSRQDIGNTYILYGFEGIKYAVDNGAKIINCSFAGYGYSNAEQEVINYAVKNGALVVAAAGNDDIELPAYPAGYDGVFSVGGSTSADLKWVDSNYGYTIDVVAPALNIYSTWGTDGHMVASGTSLSSPMVAGLAALVKNQFPSYTPLQVAEQIRATCDNIYSLNADSLKYKFGTGRINAYRALSTTNAVSIRAKNVVFTNETDNTYIYSAGSTVSIKMTFTNYLSPVSNAQAFISTSSPYVTLVNSSFTIGSLGTLDTLSNSAGKFLFTVNNNAPTNQKIEFLITYTANGFSGFQWVTVNVRQTYGIMAGNNISLTVTSKGNLGFDDFPNNTLGTGMHYLTGENILFEGSFMYGTSDGRLCDAARSTSGTQSNDFHTLNPFIKKSTSLYADLEGYTFFNDSNASIYKVGIETRLHAYTYKTSPYNDFIILRTTLVNKSTADIHGLYAGWFFDFDLDENDPYNNMVNYDSVNKIIYAYNPNSAKYKYFVGAALLSNQNIGVYALNNNANNNGVNLSTQFTKTAKWTTLTSGTTNTTAGPADISFVISSGPVDIAKDSSANITFVLAIGESLSALKTVIDNSKTKYITLPKDNGAETRIAASSYNISQNFPNPFSTITKILYDLPKDDFVKIKVFDILGRQIAVLVNEYKTAGKNYVTFFNGARYPSGIYFYQIETSKYVKAKKMVLVK